MTTPAGTRAARLIGLLFGILLHLIVGVFHLGSGLVAPTWAAVVLMVEWLGLFGLLLLWRDHPARVLAIPFVSALIWWAAVTAGDRWLGWTA